MVEAEVDGATAGAGRGPGGRRIGRAIAYAVGGGLLLGAVTYLTQLTPAGWTTNAVATWAAVAFAVGAAVGVAVVPIRRATLAAVGALLVALVTWYGIAQAVLGLYSPSALRTAAVWVVAALVAGTVFGAAGAWWWQRPRTWAGATGVALLVAAFAATALYDGVTLGYPVPAATNAAVAVVLLVSLGLRVRPWWRPLAVTVPLVLLGLAGYALLNLVLSG